MADAAETQVIIARAGFWRRLGALIVDLLVVTLPLQALVIVLFAQTNGVVQGTFGIVLKSCQPLAELPIGLDPPPPEGFNSIVDCRTSFFGLDMARVLVVSKVTQDGAVTTSIFQSYAIGADGHPTEAYSTDWIAILLFFAYLISMEHRSGATLGKRMLGIRTFDTAGKLTLGFRTFDAAFLSRAGIPLRKAVLRQLAIVIGSGPLIAGGIVAVAVMSFGGVDPAAIFSSGVYVPYMILAAAINVVWFVWIAVSVSRKRDPIYDRLVGTAVLRT
jgi:uncharacterized RDD family membrane protein YckC